MRSGRYSKPGRQEVTPREHLALLIKRRMSGALSHSLFQRRHNKPNFEEHLERQRVAEGIRTLDPQSHNLML